MKGQGQQKQIVHKQVSFGRETWDLRTRVAAQLPKRRRTRKAYNMIRCTGSGSRLVSFSTLCLQNCSGDPITALIPTGYRRLRDTHPSACSHMFRPQPQYTQSTSRVSSLLQGFRSRGETWQRAGGFVWNTFSRHRRPGLACALCRSSRSRLSSSHCRSEGQHYAALGEFLDSDPLFS